MKTKKPSPQTPPTSLHLAAMALASVIAATPGAHAQAIPLNCDRTFTTDSDFNEGTLTNVNHDDPNQLQLNDIFVSRPYIWVANSARGTVARVDTDSGQILGEYRSAPQGRGTDPSRTTVDLDGNVWVGNRAESSAIGGVPHGSVVKIGFVIGGTRGDKNPDGSLTPNPAGEYLQPPFLASTAVDRDGDGLIRTSGGLGQILGWTDVTDGLGSTGMDGSALVQDAADECLLIYQRLPDAEAVRHVSVDSGNNVWIGGHPFAQRSFHRLRGTDGQIMTSFDARPFNAGGYGGLIDGNGVLWSSSINQNALLRYDPATSTGTTLPIAGSYGTAIDTNGYIWNTMYFSDSIVKISPAGVIEPGFPKTTGGGGNDRGVAVTPVDNHVWVANSGGSSVSRLDNSGNVLQVIPVGLNPTGVSVDSNGKVWVTNLGSDNAMRINPNVAGLAVVDLTVSLGAGAGPYNYSDMTGSQLLNAVQQGTWSVVHDSMSLGTEWGTLAWNSQEPVGTSLKVEVRSADTMAALGTLPFLEVGNGVDFCARGLAGQFLEVRVTMAREPGVIGTPVLLDLSVACCNQPPVAVCEDITVPTDPGECVATVDPLQVAGDSYDPDGDEVTLELVPAGPYPLGETLVQVVVTDPQGLTAVCEAIITVVDIEPPQVACIQGTNPSGRNVPRAGDNPRGGQNPDGFYKLEAVDNCVVVEIYLVDSVSGFVAGPYQSGAQVKITQAPGVKPVAKPGAGAVVAHLLFKGDPSAVAVDAAGNTATTSCLVPPPPK